MATTKAQQMAVDRYNAKNYDRLYIRVKKGKGEEIKAHASKMGESLNEFLNRAIDKTIESDNNS